MATGPNKRASMREGPLAALFRKTEEGEEPTGAQPEPEAAAAPPAPEPTPAPAPPRQEPVAAEPKHVPHPSLAVPPVADPRIPSPQERLRHAFSSDLPENLMDRGGRDSV